MDQATGLRNLVKSNNIPSRPISRVITVTSGKGGVGKSNTSINLAIQFRKLGQRVIILDADFGLANIEIMFGAVPKHNLCDLIYQNKSTAMKKLDLPRVAQYDFWLAEYGDEPSYYYDYAMWQYTSDGSVPGIDSRVDLNLCFKDYANGGKRPSIPDTYVPPTEPETEEETEEEAE